MLAPLDSSDPQKIVGMTGHMILANAVLILMTIRLVIRIKTQLPPDADAGFSALNKVAKLAHYALYALVFAMVASGWGMAIAAGLPGIMFGESTTPLPEDLTVFPARVAHGVFASILMLLVFGHFVAALYHQFVRKDKLLARMWFGSRT